MKILTGNHKKVALPVTIEDLMPNSISSVAQDIKDMLEMIDKQEFTGLYASAWALSHSQVSTEPKRFFVLDKTVAKGFKNCQVIANAKILAKSLPMLFQEACMSFPTRPPKQIRRYDKVQVEADLIIDGNKLVKEILDLEGLEAFIVQHEVDHANGIDIYSK